VTSAKKHLRPTDWSGSKNIDHFVEHLEPMDPSKDVDSYNKHQLCQIARKFHISFIQVIKKKDLLEKINEVLIKREENRKLLKAEAELQKKNMLIEKAFEDLVIDEFRIQARSSDGYINATQLCTAGGKRFNNWYQLHNTKEFINA
jgi:hypothetical protein